MRLTTPSACDDTVTSFSAASVPLTLTVRLTASRRTGSVSMAFAGRSRVPPSAPLAGWEQPAMVTASASAKRAWIRTGGQKGHGVDRGVGVSQRPLYTLVKQAEGV